MPTMRIQSPQGYAIDVDVESALALFASLKQNAQAAILRALDNPALRPYVARLDWGDGSGARDAVRALAVAPAQLIANFLTQLIARSGVSIQYRPSGDPPPAPAAPDPWAGLAGSGLGTPVDATTGQRFDPRTGQPIPAGTDPAAVIGQGIGQGIGLLGQHLTNESMEHRAEVAANAAVTAATARATADQRIAEINAQRDIQLAEIRARMSASGADPAAIQASLATVMAQAQAQAQQAAQYAIQQQTMAPQTPATTASWWSTASTPAKVAVVGLPVAAIGTALFFFLRK